jgi:hypothetical protein
LYANLYGEGIEDLFKLRLFRVSSESNEWGLQKRKDRDMEEEDHVKMEV